MAEQVRLRQRRRFGAVGYTVRHLGSYLVWRLRGKGHDGALARSPLTIEAEWVSRRTALADDQPERATGQLAGGLPPLDR